MMVVIFTCAILGIGLMDIGERSSMKDLMFYLVSDSVEDDVQGSKESTVKKARKIMKILNETGGDTGCLPSDDMPLPTFHIYKIERIA